MYCLYVGVDYIYIDINALARGLNPFWPHKFGFTPLLGLEPMAPIRPQLLVMYVCMHACMCVYMYVCMHACMYVCVYLRERGCVKIMLRWIVYLLVKCQLIKRIKLF